MRAAFAAAGTVARQSCGWCCGSAAPELFEERLFPDEEIVGPYRDAIAGGAFESVVCPESSEIYGATMGRRGLAKDSSAGAVYSGGCKKSHQPALIASSGFAWRSIRASTWSPCSSHQLIGQKIRAPARQSIVAVSCQIQTTMKPPGQINFTNSFT